MIDEIIVDKILNEAKIVDVVDDFLTLHKRGVRYLALCPFHDDHHLGSFVVYPKSNCFKCFKCGEKGGPVDFLMKREGMSFPDAIRWLGKKYNIDTDVDDFQYDVKPAPPPPPPLPTLELPMRMVTAREVVTEGAQDNLVDWIRNGIKWDKAARSRIDKMLGAYHIGHSRQGHTIFWQIDEQGKVRTGKMMKYKPDGHRDKEAAWNFDFIHSVMSRRRDQWGRVIEYGPYPYPDIFNPDKQEMRQTLFGMHLLNTYGRDASVCIVESEKTALLMSIAYGNHARQVWMACGGLENLSQERLKPIIMQHRKIILYPDRDAIKKWRQKAEQLHYDRLSVNVEPVVDWWLECDGEKADIADVVIRIINKSKPITTTQQLRERMPNADMLLNKFNCEIVNEG